MSDEVQRHLDAIEAAIQDAAHDSGLSEDEVWHDVATGYVQCEVTDPKVEAEVRRRLGMYGGGGEW